MNAPGRPPGETRRAQHDGTPLSASPPTVASPCVNVCRMDEATGVCEGCLRTLDEIACWSLLDDAEKQAVCEQLPQRRTARAPSATPPKTAA